MERALYPTIERDRDTHPAPMANPWKIACDMANFKAGTALTRPRCLWRVHRTRRRDAPCSHSRPDPERDPDGHGGAERPRSKVRGGAEEGRRRVNLGLQRATSGRDDGVDDAMGRVVEVVMSALQVRLG
jgi:hypothetical protein